MALFRNYSQVKNNLGIETKLSAPWHFQSHGDVERANRTLESIIRKFIDGSPRDWDENVHLLCFALRSVPHSGSKYSANYLVFGTPVRGLLDIEREGWEGEDTDKERLKMSTAAYLENLNKNIRQALETAKENLHEVRSKQYFDRQSSQRKLQSGDKVLLILPTITNKLFAKLNGPYTVVEKCPDYDNYIIQIGQRRARMHINNLRRYHKRDAEMTATAEGGRPGATLMVINDCETLDGEAELIIPSTTDDGHAPWLRVQLGEELNDDQRHQLQRLLAEYPDVLSDQPGCTHLIQHSIKLNDTTPVYQTSYRVPDSLKEAVEKS